MNSFGGLFFFLGLMVMFWFMAFITPPLVNHQWDNYLVKNDLAHYDAKTAKLILNKTGERVYK